jgi:pimeloyl-ACP methyl ester carboxylesterase
MSQSVKVRRGFLDIPEGQIHYRTAGDGPPLVIVHPHTYSSELFAEVIPIMATKYRVVAFDRMGHGPSDPIPESSRFIQEFNEPDDKGPTYPYDDDVRVIVHVMAALGLDRSIILGQHGGAHMSIELAILHPELIEKLILISIPDWSGEEERQRIRQTFTDTFQHTKNMDGSHLAEEWRTKQAWASPSTTPEIMDRTAMMGLQSRRPWPHIAHEVIRQYYIANRIPLVKVPTLLMAGEHDFAGRFTRQQAGLFAEGTLKNTAIVEGAGAFFALEKPQELAQHVLDFLEG